MLAVFLGAFGIGYLLISKVPQVLHTPLMSMTNAISAVTLLGAFLVFAADTTPAERFLGAVAIAGAAFNAIGGFRITDRMVRLFRKRTAPGTDSAKPEEGEPG